MAGPPPAGEEGAGASTGEDGISLDRLLALVEAAGRGDRQAGKEAWAWAQELQGPGAPAGHRALGRALQRLLAGQRGPEALRGLPDDLRAPAEELLRRLELAGG